MNARKLAKMANQIAANLDFGSHEAQSVAEVADHLLRFWTGDMRKELAEAHERGAVELSEIAALALDAASRPGATPQVSGPGGDAG
jgi:hypothetical protein